MTLTMGGGPLAGRVAERRNFEIDAPEHRLLLEEYPHRLRAVVAGRVVLDSTRASVLHEGDASYWTLDLGDEVVEDAVWAYEQPIESARWLAGLAALKWGLADAWYVEDETAFGPHLRNPYHRVDVYETSRPVTVRAGGRVIAQKVTGHVCFPAEGIDVDVGEPQGRWWA